tara:strand:+ start:207 stop:1193 length:987 start_codon:yes stop_codon:yes gene_type:complete
MNFLVTGAAGYIGSHFTAKILQGNNPVIGIDNFSNSSIDQIQILKKIHDKNFKFFQCDILDLKSLDEVFKSNKIDVVVHFAALKSVPESFKKSEEYFLNNVVGTRNLLNAMRKGNVRNIIFSSSAAVYGNSSTQPLCESTKLSPESVYGETKKICEESIISETMHNDIKAIILRYFNPVGFNKAVYNFSDRIFLNESLISNILAVVNGKKHILEIYGGDFNTPDGTPQRDFIHINDLVKSHEISISYLDGIENYEIFNVGTGNPVSVMEFITKFSKINNVDVPYRIINRRKGDSETSYTSCKKILNKLSFQTNETLDSMCADSLVNFN